MGFGGMRPLGRAPLDAAPTTEWHDIGTGAHRQLTYRIGVAAFERAVAVAAGHGQFFRCAGFPIRAKRACGPSLILSLQGHPLISSTLTMNSNLYKKVLIVL